MAVTPDHPRSARAAQRETVRVPVQREREARAREPRGGERRDDRGPVVRRGGKAPLPLAAAVTALWAAVVSALPVAVVVALAQLIDAPSVSLSGAVRFGLAGWLLAHGVPLHTGLGPVGLAPLAVAALAAWRVARAGVHTTRAIGARRTGSVRLAASAAVAVAFAYGLLGAAAAMACRGPELAVSAGRAGVTLGVFGLVSAAAGALSASGAFDRLSARTPTALRDGTWAGVVAALLLLATGAALAGVATAVSGREAAETLASYRTGVAGQVGLTLICLAYAPNVTVWAVCYLVGPGFSVGVDTTVRTSDVTLGALPAVPVFAPMPSGPVEGGWVLLLGTPLAAGMVAGWLLVNGRTRRLSRPAGPEPRWLPLLGAAALTGPVAGALLGVAAYASAGPLGAGRLSDIGPVGWQVAIAAAGVVACGAVVGAAGARAAVGRH